MSRPSAAQRVFFGSAYYAEYQQFDRLEQDLELMSAAGFTVIRVGESVWSTWEPADGTFNLDWMQRVLDRADAYGISVVLGTPTYAIPPWLQQLHPEIAAERQTGERVPWGARQEVDYSHPTFRIYAERVIRAVVSRYAAHPAVIGFQLDNEPGLQILHNQGAFDGFVEHLQAVYGDVATLNAEWGLTYWSHRIEEWSELWRPDGNSSPQYDLAWRRYQAALTTDFISWQAKIVREYRRDDQFVTTCIAYSRPALDDVALATALDVTAGNPYYGMQDHLTFGVELAPVEPWATTGVWGLFRQADRIFSTNQSRFLVTETNAQAIGGPHNNYPPYPGQLMQAALAFVARGAQMIEYWHWHTLHFGAETYWGGVLPHSQEPGRVYREVAEIGATLAALDGALMGYEPDADVALVYSQESKWAMEFTPPLSDDANEPESESYGIIFDSFYRGVIESGAQARIVHMAQLVQGTPAEAASRHRVLVVPALYVASDDQLKFLHDYANAGGHLVLGVRTGYGDHEARARAQVAPAILAASAGVWYEEFSNLEEAIPVLGTRSLPLSAGAAGEGWADGLIPDGAEVLATYDHGELGRFPAITSTAFGEGRITYVGTVPNPPLARDLMQWLVPERIAAPWQLPDASCVTVASGRVADGSRVWFLHNWGPEALTIPVPAATTDLVSGEALESGASLLLEPRASNVLAGQLLFDGDEATLREGM